MVPQMSTDAIRRALDQVVGSLPARHQLAPLSAAIAIPEGWTFAPGSAEWGGPTQTLQNYLERLGWPAARTR